MLGSSRLTVSRIKHLSGILGCSFWSLRHNVCCKISKEKFYSTGNTIGKLKPSLVHYSTAYTESPFGNIDLDSITKGDEELLKKLKVIILEVEVMRQEGLRVPKNMTDSRWRELLALPSRSQRLKTLAFWWLNEKKKESDKEKKVAARLRRKETLQKLNEENGENGHIAYGFGGSTMFIRIYDSTINHFYNSGLIRSMLFGQNIVIDCSYDANMNLKEAALCAKQLKILFSDNRFDSDPFNIHFCNVNRDGNVFTKLHKSIPTMYDDEFPMNITEESYLSLFPKERLVYLTPHCREELREYNHDDVYIIGAMVDKVNNDPLSLGKAKSQGLRMAKLPLERYLDWGIGGKSLTINQMLLILLELKASNDWKKALQHVPRRKLKYNNFNQRHVIQLENSMR